MNRRIAIGGLWHETNTFAARPTRLEDFERYQLARGEALLARYRDTNTEIGGMMAAAGERGLEPRPLLFAAAVPSGVIEAQAFGALSDELAERLEAEKPVEGVALALHGAAVADGVEDADARVLEVVRSVLGPRLPVVATFDFHANLGEGAVAGADLLVGYDTYPHVDMAERGREAVALLAVLLEGAGRPARAFRKLPLLTAPQAQSTDEQPMRAVMARLHAIESRAGVVCGSIAMGFPYADVPRLGASVLVYAQAEGQAEAAADELAAELWARRGEFEPALTPVEVGVAEALSAGEAPVVLVEPADNVGGGSAGDGALVLDALLAAGAEGAVVVIADPEAVAAAEAAGEGGAFDHPVGGKTDRLHGPPVRVSGRVRRLVDGRYRHKGSYMTGYVTAMGATAVVEAGGVELVLTSLRTMPFDAEQLRSLGIEPERRRVIVVKSAVAWRAAYGSMARRVIVLDTPGITASRLERLPYRRRPLPLYPLERDPPFATGESPS